MGFVGMAADQVREHAERLRAAARQLESEHSALTGCVQGSRASWIGPDAESFRGAWADGAGQLLLQLIGELGRSASVLEADVEEQEAASSPDASDAVPSGPGGGGSVGGGRAGGRHGGGDGQVSPEVARAWEAMSREDREKVLQEVVDQELESLGLPPTEIHFDDLDDRDGTLGYWIEHPGRFWRGEHIVLDSSALADPFMLNVAAHEARHAAQNHWIEETEEPPGWQFWREDDSAAEIARLEREHGVTPEDLEAWRENDRDYRPGPDEPRPDETAPQAERDAWDEEFREYREQPLEVDAYDTGDDFADDLTVEELQQYQEAAGVPVTS